MGDKYNAILLFLNSSTDATKYYDLYETEEFEHLDKQEIKLLANTLKKEGFIDIRLNGPLYMSFHKPATGERAVYNQLGRDKLMAKIEYKGIQRVKEILAMENEKPNRGVTVNGNVENFNAAFDNSKIKQTNKGEKKNYTIEIIIGIVTLAAAIIGFLSTMNS